MKSNGHPSLYFSPHSQKSQKQGLKAKAIAQSPYLRAVLSDRTMTRPSRLLSAGNTSLDAALRYIANSK